MKTVSFNEFRAQLQTWQPRINSGEIVALTCATCRYRREFAIVAYAVHVGIREQLPQLPIFLSSVLVRYPRQARATLNIYGGLLIRGDKIGDRFVLLSPELYASIMEEPEQAQIVS